MWLLKNSIHLRRDDQRMGGACNSAMLKATTAAILRIDFSSIKVLVIAGGTILYACGIAGASCSDRARKRGRLCSG
jgi:hypothetical protein